MTDNNNNSNSSNNSSDNNNTGRGRKNINVRFPQLKMEKNIFVIVVLLFVVGVVAFLNIAQVFNTQTNLVNQNDRIIADIDNNSLIMKNAMKQIGNATLQRNAVDLLKRSSIEISYLKQILNDTNEKLDRVLPSESPISR